MGHDEMNAKSNTNNLKNRDSGNCSRKQCKQRNGHSRKYNKSPQRMARICGL